MRNMRNWWVEATVEGRKHHVEFGPKAKDGGMAIDIFQRVNGQSKKVATMNCYHSGETLIAEFTPWPQENVTIQKDMPHFWYSSIRQTRIKSSR